MRFNIYKIGATWLWELRAGNGQIIAQAPDIGFTTKQGAIRACDRLIDGALSASVFVNGKELGK
jgi:uncharacterized protein YegP (UPF0339 family)